MAPTPSVPDVKPEQAWQALKDDPDARLVDVRTQPEWSYVGVPDLAETGKKIVLLSWQVFPSMARNEAFAEQLAAQGVKPDTPLYFLCRSGARSRAAAEHMAEKGFGRCHNVQDGFEGPADGARHRGTLAGWKAAGLPWIQG